MRLIASFACLIALTTAAAAQTTKEPLVAQVKRAIDRGVRQLKTLQMADGSFERDKSVVIPYPGGESALATLALLNAGVPLEDETMRKAMAYLRRLEPGKTYVRSLQTMVFAEAGQPEDRQRIRDNVNWLIDARVMRNGQLLGWTYGKQPSKSPDNSNTQYALLGLWAGRQAGVDIDRKIWQSIRDFYLTSQDPDGAWVYALNSAGVGFNQPSLTMTTAGLCGLLISGMELNVGREVIGADGVATGCGVYEENKAAAKALAWIGTHFTIENAAGRVFYNLYGLERTGRLTGQRFIGGHDWYREGCQFLVGRQNADGSWSAPGNFDRYPTVSTSFALLFLSKGRTPILISKLAHGIPVQRRDSDTDWNNDRNDLKNLVAFAGEQLFTKLRLGWQAFDIMRAASPRGDTLTEDDEAEATAELLQSPIIYFNGHKSPEQRFTAVEKRILQRAIDNGGFIFAEACCGSPQFDLGFKKLVAELWPENDLTELDGNHPVWKSFFPIAPGNPYKLYGLNLGCKTVLIYSPQDLSCQWESNNYKTGKGLAAFRLGTNIIAYATGREPPKPRLTQVEVASNAEPRSVPRGFLKVAQIRHRGDWHPAPKAMRNLLGHLHKVAGLDVALKTEDLPVDNPGIVDFKFLYMQGRGQFHFDEEELGKLRFNLQNGGLLFADACCGKEAFDKAFRALAKQLFPKETLVTVPASDLLYGKELNGTALTDANIKLRRDIGGAMVNAAPYLEGIKINDRWAILYSKYDIGCALERHQSMDCRGYQPDSAFKIAGAAVLYSLRP